jgi:hypothetical protein
VSKPLDIEQRAAEIVAAIQNERTAYFVDMTPGEQIGWDMHDDPQWRLDAPNGDDTPRNRREWAGWLAREICYARAGVL